MSNARVWLTKWLPCVGMTALLGTMGSPLWLGREEAWLFAVATLAIVAMFSEGP